MLLSHEFYTAVQDIININGKCKLFDIHKIMEVLSQDSNKFTMKYAWKHR